MKTPGRIAERAWQQTFDWDRVAAVVLASQWHSVSEPPANKNELVLVAGKLCPTVSSFACMAEYRTHWAPIPPVPEPPKPTPEEIEREVFDKWYDKHAMFTAQRENMWLTWQAARKTPTP